MGSKFQDAPGNVGTSRIRQALRIGIPAAVVGLLAFSLIMGYVMTGPADRPPTGVETLAANSLRRAFIPIHARVAPQPPTASTAALVEGRKIFRQRCVQCHGGNGQGDSSLAGAFYPPVPDLTGPAIQHWSDRDLFWTVQNGIRMTGMPAWRSSLSEQQIWAIVAYLRRLSRQDQNHGGRELQNSNSRQLALDTIEDEGCRDCHTIDGTGAKIGPNLSDEWARGRSDAWLIGHFRRPSAYTPGTPMPSFDHLTNRQLNALVRYLQDSDK